MTVMRLAPALILLLLALPAAAAQAPPPTCGPLTATVTVPGEALRPGEEGQVTLVVENAGNLAVEIVVSIGPPPAGWTLANPEEQRDTLPAGGSGSFTFTVSPTAQAAGDFPATLNAEGVCALPAPGVPCPNNACTTNAPPQGATVRLAPPSGPSLDLGIPVEYLVAGVVLVGVASAIPLLLRRRRHGFAAECPEPLKMVRPGRGTSFPIEIRNASQQPMTARLEVGPVPEGWTAFMPLPEVQLAPRESRSLWLMVRSPPEAAQGDAADVELRLVDAARPDEAATVRVRAEVDPAAAEGAPRP